MSDKTLLVLDRRRGAGGVVRHCRFRRCIERFQEGKAGGGDQFARRAGGAGAGWLLAGCCGLPGATVIVGHTISPYRGPHFALGGGMDPAAQKFGGLCQSACVFILAGGVKRLVPTGGFVAVHRPANFTRETVDARPARLIKKPIDDADALVERLKAYFAEMGVGAPVLDLMVTTPPTHMRF